MQVSATTWSTLSKLLDEALDLDAAARDTWLERLSATQPALAPAVRQLLAAHASSETADVMARLPTLNGAASAMRVSALQAGDRIGPYRLKRELGSGGMADVWLAERADGAFTREVALKLPLINRLRRDLAQRFVRERDILARLEHPHIARLYDAGVTDDALPYLAMEYVDGQPITEYCDHHNLDIETRLKLFRQVLDAVQFAHANLTIHRDLKPSNILVTADSQVRLLDFGIAKLLAEDDTAKETQLTQLSGRALTPDYASPEQIKGEAVGTATDVYSLGVVLYELLTGSRPYRLARGSVANLEEAIATLDPAKASDSAKDPAAKKLLRGDLDAILNKTLRKSVSARYLTVDALAQDIKRHLNSEPVMAQPDAFTYRVSKFLSRYRLQVLAGSTALCALLAGATVALIQAQRADEERHVADAERNVAVAANERAVASRIDAERQANIANDERTAALVARELAERFGAGERKAAAEAEVNAKRAAVEAKRAVSEAERAQLESEQAKAVRDYLLDLFRTANPAQADARKMQSMTALELLDRGVARVDNLTAAPAVKVELLSTLSEINAMLGRYDVHLNLSRRAAEEAAKVHGTDSFIALRQQVSLARASWQNGRTQEAISTIEKALPMIRERHPESLMYANALTSSSMVWQSTDVQKALTYAQQAVKTFDVIAVKDGQSGKLEKTFPAFRARAIERLGMMQQIGGATAQSEVTMRSAAALFADLYGENSQDVVSTRSRLLFSLLALGKFDEVVRESPALITAAAHFDAETNLRIPLIRLYYGRALAALGRFPEGREQMKVAFEERSRISNSLTQPRTDIFRAQIALISLEESNSAEALSELEAMLAAGDGIPASRISWHQGLLRAYRESGNLPRAREHAAQGERLIQGGGVAVESALYFLVVAAPLYASDAADHSKFEDALRRLRVAETTSESDHQKALFRIARVQALEVAERRSEAAAELRPLFNSGINFKALQHQWLRAQIDRLSNDLLGRVEGSPDKAAHTTIPPAPPSAHR